MFTKVFLVICSMLISLFTFSNFNEYKPMSSHSADICINLNDSSAPASGFSVSNFNKVSMKLGEEVNLKGAVQVAKSYNGTLELSIVRSSVDPLGAVGANEIQLNLSIVIIKNGELAPVKLKFEDESMAPLFSASNINIKIKGNQQNYSASTSVVRFCINHMEKKNV